MIDLLNKDLVTRIISEISNTEEIERKTNSYNSYQVYSGNIKPYVKTELQRMRPKSWKTYTISDISVSKMITDKLSRAYQTNPIRSVINSPEKTDLLDEIYFKSESLRQFKEFDSIFNRERHALFWLNWRSDIEKFAFMALQPYEFSVIRDKDHGDLKAVVLQYPDTSITHESGQGDGYSSLIAENQADAAGQSKVYAMWTDTQHVVVKIITERILNTNGEQIKKSIEYVPIKDNPNNVNPLGILPFVYMSKDNSPEYPTESPVTEQTITFNALMSELLTSANIQGTGQLILKYSEDMQGKLDALQHGLTTAIELPQPTDPNSPATDATYINPSPDLSGQQSSYANYLKLVLSEHGISSSQGLDGSVETFSSGLERMIAQADVQNTISDNQQTYYQILEKKLFKILKRWDKVLGFNNFSEDDQISIKYEKPKVMVSDSEKLNNIKMMIEMGAIERHEMFMMLDPNLSEDDAKEKLQRIDSENTLRVGAFLDGSGQEDNS